MSAPTTEYQKYQADLERRAKATGTSAQELERAETLVEQARRKNGKGQPIPKPLSDEERAELRKVQLRERRPELWTATQIVTTDFPDPKWIVPGLIPEGFAILAGVPKLGKSWMGLNLAIAVSVGGRFLGEIEVEQGGVLLLSLEDTPRRLKNRLLKMGFGGSEALHVATAWQKGAEATAQIDLFLADNPDVRIVLVDTLARIISIDDGRDYLETYEAVGALKRVADAHAVAIVAIHHVGKTQRDDWVQSLMDSTGYGAAADTLLAATRRRGQVDAVLKLTGRDIEEQELALSFDADICTWRLLGDATEIQDTRERQELVDYLKANGPTKSGELARALQCSPQATTNLLVKLEREGIVRSPEYGKWEAVKPGVCDVSSESGLTPDTRLTRVSEGRQAL